MLTSEFTQTAEQHYVFEEWLKTVTVIMSKIGEYYASLLVNDEGLRVLALATSAMARADRARPKRRRESSVEFIIVEWGSPVQSVGGSIY
ncbi:hypothetical protein [Oscillatoria sp. FACHB-1406]|uniref:hypothetical protein n=1 Tax=Oscillatoria sp. FACHB-1406 TaxID=2692846 RepID=UPI001685F2B4|nr:hypothetical protein [Oscillatoria sp. FACHB-1406]MBD2576099.1 hypothetical protein [Oscillatoria sp. FACHB-1406]